MASFRTTPSASRHTGPRHSAGRRRTPTCTATSRRSFGSTAAMDPTRRWIDELSPVSIRRWSMSEFSRRRARSIRRPASTRLARLLRVGNEHHDGPLPLLSRRSAGRLTYPALVLGRPREPNQRSQVAEEHEEPDPLRAPRRRCGSERRAESFVWSWSRIDRG